MPKRGGRLRNWKPNEHFEHDDRGTHSNNTRRVSFKPGTNKGKNKYLPWNEASHQLLLEGDSDMGASGGYVPNRKGFRSRGGRLGSPAPRPASRKKFIPGVLPCYQVIIPYGAKHEKDVILRVLLGYMSPEVFIPHYYRINGNAAIFYVDDVKIAEKLFYADRKIVMSDGFKLVVIVRNSLPNVTIDEDMKEKMKLAMPKRYNATTKALDLTKFHADPDLADNFCALFRPMIMMAAINIIAENIPDLEALNLNDNKLHGIEHLKILSTKFKNLKILYLGDNRIPFLGSLDSVKQLPLVELYLKGNPLVNRFSDHDIYVSLKHDVVDFNDASFKKCFSMLLFRRKKQFKYHNIKLRVESINEYGYHMECFKRVTSLKTKYKREFEYFCKIQTTSLYLPMFVSSDVRKKFPKLVRLDGAELPPAIGFDVSEEVNLPTNVQSFLIEATGQDLVRQFLSQYFTIYDSESRQPLLEAYHETAMMSMAASYLSGDCRNTPENKLNAYISKSRNIMRITERESRRRYLKVGRLQVVSFLSELPKTKHDLLGFAVDLPIFSPAMIVLTVNGVYRETNVTGNPTRAFHRTFVIVPNPTGGLSVTNDMLFVTNTTSEQEDKAFSSGTPDQPIQPAPAPVALPVAAPAPPTPAVHDDNQRMMLNMLSQQTGMNDHWSINCLQETGWDYQRALFIFNQLQSEGKIPPQAFVK